MWYNRDENSIVGTITQPYRSKLNINGKIVTDTTVFVGTRNVRSKGRRETRTLTESGLKRTRDMAQL